MILSKKTPSIIETIYIVKRIAAFENSYNVFAVIVERMKQATEKSEPRKSEQNKTKRLCLLLRRE